MKEQIKKLHIEYAEEFKNGVTTKFFTEWLDTKDLQSDKTEQGLINVPYQKCPKCDGQGWVSKPPFVAGDVYGWSSTSATFTCNVCNGQKIIPMFQLPTTENK